MDAKQLIEAARAGIDAPSDYVLARTILVPRQYVSEWRQGRRSLDVYAVTRLAECARLDPLEVLAELESERERNPERAAWWRRFLSSLPRSGVNTMSGLLIWGVFWLAAAGDRMSRYVKSSIKAGGFAPIPPGAKQHKSGGLCPHAPRSKAA